MIALLNGPSMILVTLSVMIPDHQVTPLACSDLRHWVAPIEVQQSTAVRAVLLRDHPPREQRLSTSMPPDPMISSAAIDELERRSAERGWPRPSMSGGRRRELPTQRRTDPDDGHLDDLFLDASSGCPTCSGNSVTRASPDRVCLGLRTSRRTPPWTRVSGSPEPSTDTWLARNGRRPTGWAPSSRLVHVAFSPAAAGSRTRIDDCWRRSPRFGVHDGLTRAFGTCTREGSQDLRVPCDGPPYRLDLQPPVRMGLRGYGAVAERSEKALLAAGLGFTRRRPLPHRPPDGGGGESSSTTTRALSPPNAFMTSSRPPGNGRYYSFRPCCGDDLCGMRTRHPGPGIGSAAAPNEEFGIGRRHTPRQPSWRRTFWRRSSSV